VQKRICANKNIQCLIRGEINYRFYPTPRIKIKDLIVNDNLNKRDNLLKAKEVVIKLSIKNLLAKEKQSFKKIELNNFEISFNTENFKNYKNIFSAKTNFMPIFFKDGRIVFYEGKNYVATFHNTNLKMKFSDSSTEAELNADFLNDNIKISLNNEKIKKQKLTSTEIILKMAKLNLFTKIELINSEENKNVPKANVLIKKGKNRIASVVEFKKNEINIKNSNLRNPFLDGKLEGKITFLPYFDFDLDLNLSSLNFTKLYSYFLSLEKEERNKLFKINNKINGKLNLSSDKVYSGYNLVKSFESRLQLNNGNILIDQFLLNMGKLGAADILGSINNDKKFTNFIFESNVFVDNQKKFLSKFGIYNATTIPTNLFISGNFDLDNIKFTFYEIVNDEKLKNNEINFIEKEFNNLLLEDGYVSLFHFPKFKEFVKTITGEDN